MPESYTCWKCGGLLTGVLLPLARHEECPHCRVQLHVCRMCSFYDPAAPQQCREPVADLVPDKQHANFCGYFQVNPQAFTAVPDQAAASRRQLDALFGDEPAEDTAGNGAGAPTRDELDKLFRK